MPSVAEVTTPEIGGLILCEEFFRLLKKAESTPRPILLPSLDRLEEEEAKMGFVLGLSIPGRGIIEFIPL